MTKKRVLFVCIHNSARSQMAEELLRKLGGQNFEVESAGIETGKLDPTVVQILKEDEGIDISSKSTQSVQDLINKNKNYDFVITVCDETSAQKCPTFPGKATRLHWSFPDPSQFNGPPEEKLAKTRQVKEGIRERIDLWLRSPK